MTADRLREAADVIGGWTVDYPAAPGSRQDAATAVLLRAVAYWPAYVDEDGCCTGCYMPDGRHTVTCVWSHAVALADVILGGAK